MAFNYVSLPSNSIYQLLDESCSSVVTKAMTAESIGISKTYCVNGYNSADSARTALMTYLYTLAGSKLPTADNLPLREIEVNNTESENSWLATCTFSAYEPIENAIVGGLLRSNYAIPTLRADQVNFNCGNQSKHLYYSYDNQWKVKGNITGDTTPLKDFYNAIKVQDSAVAGVDVPTRSASMQIEFFAPRDWLTSTVTIPNDHWLIKHGNTTTLGGGDYTRFQLLGILCGTINQFSWSPFNLEKGCVRFSDWQAQPTFFETKRAGSNEKIKDWYYSVNMTFDYIAPRYITTHQSTDYTAEGWSEVWEWGQQMFDQYSTRQVGFKQYNCDQVYEYGNFNYIGFNWWV